MKLIPDLLNGDDSIELMRQQREEGQGNPPQIPCPPVLTVSSGTSPLEDVLWDSAHIRSEIAAETSTICTGDIVLILFSAAGHVRLHSSGILKVQENNPTGDCANYTNEVGLSTTANKSSLNYGP